MSDDPEEAIIAAEARRCATMLEGNAGAYADLLDEDLQFTHANGTVDDKAALVSKIAEKLITYSSIMWAGQRVSPIGADHAMVTGRMSTGVVVDGVTKHLENRVIAVWRNRGAGWRLLAFQSTPIKA